jgi:hypothetical protein
VLDAEQILGRDMLVGRLNDSRGDDREPDRERVMPTTLLALLLLTLSFRNGDFRKTEPALELNAATAGAAAGGGVVVVGAVDPDVVVDDAADPSSLSDVECDSSPDCSSSRRERRRTTRFNTPLVVVVVVVVVVARRTCFFFTFTREPLLFDATVAVVEDMFFCSTLRRAKNLFYLFHPFLSFFMRHSIVSFALALFVFLVDTVNAQGECLNCLNGQCSLEGQCQ